MTASQPRSAGILLFRQGLELEVLLAHPGGPFWRNKQRGAWSIPKGLVNSGEGEQEAAIREFAEETGHNLDPECLVPLGEVQLRSRKTIVAWACRGDLDPGAVVSNSVRLEWPSGSGRIIEFPEVDEVKWCTLDEAAILLNTGQLPLLERLKEYLDHGQ